MVFKKDNRQTAIIACLANPVRACRSNPYPAQPFLEMPSLPSQPRACLTRTCRASLSRPIRNRTHQSPPAYPGRPNPCPASPNLSCPANQRSATPDAPCLPIQSMPGPAFPRSAEPALPIRAMPFRDWPASFTWWLSLGLFRS